MAVRHDFKCPVCGYEEPNRVVPTPQFDANHDRVSVWPYCPSCLSEGKHVELQPTYSSISHDLLAHGCDIDFDDGHTRYQRRVSSLSEIRAIEHESEKHALNEPKCTPLVWRDFSQNHSNRHEHTLTGTSYERARAKPRGSNRTHAGSISGRAIKDGG